jgi:leucyl/phenylalanyl-tRNA--protein transferase
MASRDDIIIEITPQVLLKAYTCGIFPMAESADDPALYWIEPQQRGILPLDDLHVPKRLARTVRQGAFEVRIDSSFEAVIDGCAASRAGRRTTWINRKIRGLYRDLFDAGYCHTVEAWAGGELVGGLYGVALNGAFFGESMFSTERDASKVALVYLCARSSAPSSTRGSRRRWPTRPTFTRSPRMRSRKPCWTSFANAPTEARQACRRGEEPLSSRCSWKA